MNKIKKWVGKEIWIFCEMFHIPLGRLAPIVFGWMIGCKGRKVKDEQKR